MAISLPITIGQASAVDVADIYLEGCCVDYKLFWTCFNCDRLDISHVVRKIKEKYFHTSVIVLYTFFRSMVVALKILVLNLLPYYKGYIFVSS